MPAANRTDRLRAGWFRWRRSRSSCSSAITAVASGLYCHATVSSAPSAVLVIAGFGGRPVMPHKYSFSHPAASAVRKTRPRCTSCGHYRAGSRPAGIGWLRTPRRAVWPEMGAGRLRIQARSSAIHRLSRPRLRRNGFNPAHSSTAASTEALTATTKSE